MKLAFLLVAALGCCMTRATRDEAQYQKFQEWLTNKPYTFPASIDANVTNFPMGAAIDNPNCQFGPPGVFKTNQLMACIKKHSMGPHWGVWPCAGMIWRHSGKRWPRPLRCWQDCLPCLEEGARRSAVWARCHQQTSTFHKHYWGNAKCWADYSRLTRLLCSNDIPGRDSLMPCTRWQYGQGLEPAKWNPWERWPIPWRQYTFLKMGWPFGKKALKDK